MSTCIKVHMRLDFSSDTRDNLMLIYTIFYPSVVKRKFSRLDREGTRETKNGKGETEIKDILSQKMLFGIMAKVEHK